jgi:hypothetical protein
LSDVLNIFGQGGLRRGIIGGVEELRLRGIEGYIKNREKPIHARKKDPQSVYHFGLIAYIGG